MSRTDKPMAPMAIGSKMIQEARAEPTSRDLSENALRIFSWVRKCGGQDAYPGHIIDFMHDAPLRDFVRPFLQDMEKDYVFPFPSRHIPEGMGP